MSKRTKGVNMMLIGELFNEFKPGKVFCREGTAGKTNYINYIIEGTTHGCNRRMTIQVVEGAIKRVSVMWPTKDKKLTDIDESDVRIIRDKDGEWYGCPIASWEFAVAEWYNATYKFLVDKGLFRPL